MSDKTFYEPGLNCSRNCFIGSHNENCIMNFCSCACHKKAIPTPEPQEAPMIDKTIEDMKAAVLKVLPNAITFVGKDSQVARFAIVLSGRGLYPLPLGTRWHYSEYQAWAHAYAQLPTPDPQEAAPQALDTVEEPPFDKLSLADWIDERKQNALRIAETKSGADRAGWIEDAWYFSRCLEALARNRVLDGQAIDSANDAVRTSALLTEALVRAEAAEARVAELEKSREAHNQLYFKRGFDYRKEPTHE